ARCRRSRRALRVFLVVGDRCVVELAVGHWDSLDRLGEEHVLRVDQVVARVLRDPVLVAERDRVERTGELAVATEDAAAHVDLVDACVAFAGRDTVLGRVLLCHDAYAVRRARRGAERAADALLEAVLVAVEAMPSAETRIDGPLVFRVLLRDRLLEELPERDGETLDAVCRLQAHDVTRSRRRAGR